MFCYVETTLGWLPFAASDCKKLRYLLLHVSKLFLGKYLRISLYQDMALVTSAPFLVSPNFFQHLWDASYRDLKQQWQQSFSSYRVHAGDKLYAILGYLCLTFEHLLHCYLLALLFIIYSIYITPNSIKNVRCTSNIKLKYH